jgi:hypothetical protein
MKYLVTLLFAFTSAAFASKIETTGTKTVDGIHLTIREVVAANDTASPLKDFVKTLKTKKFEDEDDNFSFECKIDDSAFLSPETTCDIKLKEDKMGSANGDLQSNFGTIHLYWRTAQAMYKFFGKTPGFGAIDINVDNRLQIWGAHSLIRIVVR